MNQEESKKIFKRILEYFDVGEVVDTPFGRGTVYLDLGIWVQVAIPLPYHTYSGGKIILAEGMKMIATFRKTEIKRVEQI